MAEETYSFPAHLRILKPSDYKKVFSIPIKSTDKYFTVLAIRNELQHARLGLAIAKKTIRRAVDRNLIKRVIRESFRIQQRDLGTIDIVVLARKEALEVPSIQLRSSLQKHWKKLADRCNSYS